MKTFEVSVRQEYGGYIQVRAHDKKAAIAQVEELMKHGCIDLFSGSHNANVSIRITYVDEQVLSEVNEVK